MQTLVTLSRIGLAYSLFMGAIGLYNSYVWSERAYDVVLERAADASAIDARVNELKAELYFARSKQGRNQMYSHGGGALLFLSIAVIVVRARRKKPGGENAP